jgi:hypothetical protein
MRRTHAAGRALTDGAARGRSVLSATRRCARVLVQSLVIQGSMVALSFQAMVATGATVEDYTRADRIRRFDNRTLGGTIFPHWLSDGRRFYYQSFARHESPGTVFLIDPVAGSKQKLFATAALATVLARVSRSDVDPKHLPAWRLLDESKFSIRIGDVDYECVFTPLTCRVARPEGKNAVPDWAVRSPDGKWDAFIWNYNVYIRPSSAPPPEATAYRSPNSDHSGNHVFPLSDGSEDIADFHVTGQRENCDFPAPPGPILAKPPTPMPVPSGAIALTHDGERLYSYGPRYKLGDEPVWRRRLSPLLVHL